MSAYARQPMSAKMARLLSETKPCPACGETMQCGCADHDAAEAAVDAMAHTLAERDAWAIVSGRAVKR